MRTECTVRKVGIMGGTFDPIHLGHIHIAISAREEYQLQEVWFMPAGHSPNKEESLMTPAWMRSEMVALAISDYPFFRLSRMEMDAEGISYTYLTLSRLNEQYPDTQFYFIMGADSLDYLEKWAHPEIICEKAILLTAVRDEMDLVQIQKKIGELQQLFTAEIYPVCGGRTNISSTRIREAIQSGISREQIKLLPEKVLDYIRDHQLYEGSDRGKNVP